METNFDFSGNAVVISLVGDMYVEEAMVFKKSVEEQIEKGHKSFVLNLSRLYYIDSCGLGAMVSLYKKVKMNNGRLSITGATGVVKDILKLTRLEQIFDE